MASEWTFVSMQEGTRPGQALALRNDTLPPVWCLSTYQFTKGKLTVWALPKHSLGFTVGHNLVAMLGQLIVCRLEECRCGKPSIS